MQFKVENNGDFAAELAAAMPSVETKANTPMTDLIHISAKKDFVIITAVNGDIGFRSKVPAFVSKAGETLTGASKLYGWVSKIGAGIPLEVGITGKRVMFKSGAASMSLSQVSTESFPPFPKPTPEQVTIPANRLRSLMFSISSVIANFEDVRWNYAGAQIEVSNGRLVAVATDGNRLAIGNTEATCSSSEKAIISRKAAKEVISQAGRCGEDVVKISYSDNNVFFNLGTRLLYCRRMKDAFPKYEKMLPDKLKQVCVSFNTEQLEKAIQRVSCIVSQSSKITLSYESGNLRCYLANELGDSEDAVEAEGDLSFSVSGNFKYILNALRAVESERSVLAFIPGMNIFEIRPLGNDGYRNIIATMV